MSSIGRRYSTLIEACRYYNESNNTGSINRSDEGVYSYHPAQVSRSLNSGELFRFIQADLKEYSSVVKDYKPTDFRGVKKATDTIKRKFEAKLAATEESIFGRIRLFIADFLVNRGWAKNYRQPITNYNSLVTSFGDLGPIYSTDKHNRKNYDIKKVEDKIQRTLKAANADLRTKETPKVVFNDNPPKNSLEPQCYPLGINGIEAFISHLPTNNKRKTFDDRRFSESLVVEINGKKRTLSIFGVCDGYNGFNAAEFVTQHVKNVLQDKINEIANELERDGTLLIKEDQETLIFWNALKQTPLALHKNYMSSENSEGVGTTLTLVLIDGENVWTANTGDSTVVKIYGESQIKRLGEEAKKDPTNDRFARPVLNRGGTDEGGQGIWLLGTSRSIGNSFADEQGNTPSPKITRTKFDGDLVIATDGLWSVCSPEELFVFSRNNLPKTLASHLVKQARDHGSTDDITVLTVHKK